MHKLNYRMFFIFILNIFILNIYCFDEAQKLDPNIATMSPHLSQDSDSCIGQCAFAFIDKISRQEDSKLISGVLNLNYNDFLHSFSNATFFENFCKLYHNFNFCYSKCPHGYMQELLQRSSEIVDHFCVFNYKSIMDKFGCLSKLDRGISKQCLKTCTSHHNAVTSIMQHFKQLVLNGDSSQAEKYLSESCEYVICTLHCDVPTLAHICNYETADLVINLTKKCFNSMQRMALDTGAVSKWPAMCSDIKTYSLPKSPQNPPQNVSRTDIISESPKHHQNASKPQLHRNNSIEKQTNDSSNKFTNNLFLIIVFLLIVYLTKINMPY